MRTFIPVAFLLMQALAAEPVSAENLDISFEGAGYAADSGALPAPAISSVSTPSETKNRKFLIIGHRGSPMKEPDNTLEGFAQALKDGANGIETDLSITRDKTVILWHDWNPNDLVTLAREDGLEGMKYKPYFGGKRNPVNHMTLEEVKANWGYELFGFWATGKTSHQIPTFEEFAEWAAWQKTLEFIYLDIKLPEDHERYVPLFVSKIWEAAQKHGISDKLVFFSPYRDIAASAAKFAKKKNIGLKIGLDMELPLAITMEPEDKGKTRTIKSSDYATILDASKLNLEYASLGKPLTLSGGWYTYATVVLHNLRLRRSMQLNIFFLPWTINNEEEMLWLYKVGVNGIITDVPETAAKLLEKGGSAKQQ